MTVGVVGRLWPQAIGGREVHLGEVGAGDSIQLVNEGMDEGSERGKMVGCGLAWL